MLDEMRKLQGLGSIPEKKLFENYKEIRESHFALRNYYDMRDLVIRFKFVLARLSDISVTSNGTPLGILHTLPSYDPSQNPTDRIRERYTNDSIPLLPRYWSGPQALESYITELVSKKYIIASKKRPTLVNSLLLDLLRPNSPDTLHCRSTKAYNIAIKFLIHTDQLNIARNFLNEMIQEGGPVAPNTETFNILLSPTRSRLVGGRSGYRRKYFNYYLRHVMLQETKRETQSSDGSQTPNNTALDTPVTIPQQGNSSRDILEIFTPKRDDVIYLQHPLEFVTSMLRTMASLKIPADSETWNIILTCAIGPVAKSVVLKHMDEFKVPLSTMGQASVLSDIADFMGPQKVIDLITSDQSSYQITKSAIKIVVSRLVDVPTSTNIDAAWKLINKYAAPIDYNRRWGDEKDTAAHENEDKGEDSETNDGFIIPSPGLLNIFVEKFAKAGRIDWIVGVVAAFSHNWNVSPTIRTWTFIMEALTRTQHNKNKSALVSFAYNQAANIMNARTADDFPRNLRTWIRRLDAQYEFHLKKVEQNKDNWDLETYQKLRGQLENPIILRKEEDLVDASNLWNELLEKLRWRDRPLLTFNNPDYISKTSLPFATLEDAVAESLRYKSTPLGVYNSKQIDADNWATSSRDADMWRLVSSLGIRQLYVWPIQYFARYENVPRDTMVQFTEEWKLYYSDRKKSFRSDIDKNEMLRRQRMIDDPYAAYIVDLKKEFGITKDD